MKVKTKKVYYCDFCKKHSLSASSLFKHEKHCLKNIDRECRLCKAAEIVTLSKENRILIIEKIKSQMSYPVPTEKFQGINANGVKQPTLEEIKKLMSEYGWEGCPNCLLSVIILSGIHKFPYSISYNYKGEVEALWSDINSRDYGV